MASFEPLRDELETLRVPIGDARRLVWVTPERLGAALTATGSYEIFLVGPDLSASSPLVSRHLLHDKWEPEPGGSAFEATRVLLGSAPHFAAVAALIATELARYDLGTDDALQLAFNDVEPIIEMAIRRSALSDEALIGLVAELQVLRAALIAVSKDIRPIVLMDWHGWTKGRDFTFGHHALEVKATTGSQSRHHFSGVHQLEPQLLPDSGGAEQLWLLSIGLAEVDQGGQSLPDIVDDLLSLLDDGGSNRNSVQLQLLSMVAAYGESGTAGYEHDNVRHWQVYQRQFSIVFGRMYDLADPGVRLLTRELLEETFAVVESVSFTLLLPDTISSLNPSSSWQHDIAALLASRAA